ncbi:MAG: DUF4249 family protein [Bacteroidota bacterium]
MKQTIAALSVLLLAACGCSENPVLPEEQNLVLQAYLYADEPVTDITVMMSRPISSTDTSNELVSEANVTLYKNGVAYQLTASSSPGKYAYIGSDLQVQSGDQYTIQVAYDGITASAETKVPPKPVGLSTNTPTITFTKETVSTPFGGAMERVTTSDSLIVSWSNPTGAAYYVVMESIDPNRQSIRSDTLPSFANMRFVTEPTTDDQYRAFEQDINYTGKHKITLYRVNQEYVDLYKSREQDSRSLNEPLTNVKDGLGIFTAFASDSLFIDVVLQ